MNETCYLQADNEQRKKVTFSVEKLATFHHDLPDHVEALLDYRQDYVSRRLADRDRQERLLNPILQEAHRMKILKMYGRVI